MAETRLNVDDIGDLTDLEIASLQQRLAPGDADFHLRYPGAVTVKDISEATSIPEPVVVEHIRQIRAEEGFRSPLAPKASPLPWISAGVLVLALSITYWRLRSSEVTTSSPPAPIQAPTPAPITPNSVRSTVNASLPTTFSQGLQELPPPGMQVAASDLKAQYMAGGQGGPVHALPYDEVRDALVRAAEGLIDESASNAGGTVARAGQKFRGMDGGIFSPRPGFVRVAMFGWAGSESAWIAMPLTGEGKDQIRKLAERVLSDAKSEQEKALEPVPDITKGIVNPPPGYTIRFAGRRVDSQKGPRVSFSGVSADTVAKRLEAALLNAIYRDGRPPIGPWSGDAAADAKIPQPNESRIEIDGPEGPYAEDIPTGPGGMAATRRAVHALAVRLAKPIAVEIRSSIEANGTGRP